jgi:pimeloyl-ACP methyl ester carboxylesterase
MHVEARLGSSRHHYCESETVMSSDTDTVPSDHPATSKPRRTSVTRVIAASLFVGAACAMVLSLVVFAGATESIITGSMLLGFGVGWTVLAVLSTRLTSQAQRWARVPAVIMTATGVALMVITPQNGTLTWLTWLWAPALLVLTGWMTVQMRRTLAGRGRWLLTPVFVVLALACVGAVAQTITTQRNEDAYPAPGVTYSVGDHRLHLDCRGQGSPTVVLFSGLGEISTSWTKITNELGSDTRVCAYDRAGQAWSDDVASPQDGIAAAEDLHALLAGANEEGPFVLVGHSIGGPYAMTYAARYPDQVAGMVLLDSSSPRQLTDIPSYPPQYALMRRGYAVLPVLARLGAGGLVAAGAGYPADVADRLHAMTSTPRAARNARDEITTVPTLFEQAQALTTLGNLPLVVLTASESVDKTDGWAAAQEQIAELSINASHREVDSSHQGMVDDDDASAESARAIEQVVLAIRDGVPVG